jgi:hypothetical protein
MPRGGWNQVKTDQTFNCRGCQVARVIPCCAKGLVFESCRMFQKILLLNFHQNVQNVKSEATTLVPECHVEMGLRWYVRWEVRILIGQSCLPPPPPPPNWIGNRTTEHWSCHLRTWEFWWENFHVQMKMLPCIDERHSASSIYRWEFSCRAKSRCTQRFPPSPFL